MEDAVDLVSLYCYQNIIQKLCEPFMHGFFWGTSLVPYLGNPVANLEQKHSTLSKTLEKLYDSVQVGQGVRTLLLESVVRRRDRTMPGSSLTIIR